MTKPPSTSRFDVERDPRPDAAAIQQWLVQYIARLLDVTEASVDVDVPFERFGMDSSASVGMTGDLEDWLGCEIDPTLPYDYPTIEALATCLAEQARERSRR